jgi:hypothetical protein
VLLTASLCGFGTQDCGDMFAAHRLGLIFHVTARDCKKGGGWQHETVVYRYSVTGPVSRAFRVGLVSFGIYNKSGAAADLAQNMHLPSIFTMIMHPQNTRSNLQLL